MNDIDFDNLLPDPSPLPFKSELSEWFSVVNFETAEQMMANLKGDRLDDVFHVESKLIADLATEFATDEADIKARLPNIMTRWAYFQKRNKPVGIGQMCQTHLANSKIDFQIFRTEKAYFVCLPRVEIPNVKATS